ncbi:hypothetical protein ACT7DQ_27500 [Bacillus cereus]
MFMTKKKLKIIMLLKHMNLALVKAVRNINFVVTKKVNLIIKWNLIITLKELYPRHIKNLTKQTLKLVLLSIEINVPKI